MRPQTLVVEDDAKTREALRDILEDDGCDVDVAADGEQALEALARSSYDCIVLDIVLPKVSGMDVMDALRERAPDMLRHIIVVTGLNIEEIRTIFPSVCFALGKPVIPSRMLSCVRTCLRPPHAQVVSG